MQPKRHQHQATRTFFSTLASTSHCREKKDSIQRLIKGQALKGQFKWDSTWGVGEQLTYKL